MNKRVLAVDDDIDILTMLNRFFAGYTPHYLLDTATDGGSALAQLVKKPDLILLDVNLPDTDGFTLITQIRQVTSVPIIFLTARVSDQDKIRGLSAGGDDYVVKPFSLGELAARINAHLRRETTPKHQDQVAVFGSVVINYSAQTVTAGSEQLDLALKQYQLIAVLSQNPNQVFSREQLYEKVWGYDAEGDDHVIAEHIRRIRHQFEQCNVVTPIETVWGVGYRWQS